MEYLCCRNEKKTLLKLLTQNQKRSFLIGRLQDCSTQRKSYHPRWKSAWSKRQGRRGVNSCQGYPWREYVFVVYRGLLRLSLYNRLLRINAREGLVGKSALCTPPSPPPHIPKRKKSSSFYSVTWEWVVLCGWPSGNWGWKALLVCELEGGGVGGWLEQMIPRCLPCFYEPFFWLLSWPHVSCPALHTGKCFSPPVKTFI